MMSSTAESKPLFTTESISAGHPPKPARWRRWAALRLSHGSEARGLNCSNGVPSRSRTMLLIILLVSYFCKSREGLNNGAGKKLQHKVGKSEENHSAVLLDSWRLSRKTVLP